MSSSRDYEGHAPYAEASFRYQTAHQLIINLYFFLSQSKLIIIHYICTVGSNSKLFWHIEFHWLKQYLNNHLTCPLHQRMLCAKFAQWCWRGRFLNSVNVFSLFRYYLPLEMRGPSFKQIWIPFTKRCFVPSLVEIGTLVLEKKTKCLRRQWQKKNCDKKKLTIACLGELKMITEPSISKQNSCSYKGSMIEKSYQFTYSYVFHCIHMNNHEMKSYWSIKNMILTGRSDMEFSMDQQPEHQDCWTFLVLNYLENNVGIFLYWII